MKITKITPYAIDGGFRYWIFCKIETDEGIYGWGDGSDWDAPFTVTEAIKYLGQFLIGEDPMDIERIWWLNVGHYRRMWGGIAWKAMAAIDTALWDIKGKALGVPVYELLGGKMRDKLRLYWTHCGTGRTGKFAKLNDKPEIRTLKDLEDFAKIVRDSGYTACKTNIMELEELSMNEEYVKGVHSANITHNTLHGMEAIVGTFRDVCGPDFDIAVDVAFEFKYGATKQLARTLEPYKLMWLETETFDVDAQYELMNCSRTPIVHGESLYDIHGFKPYFMRHCQDGMMVDLAWNGLTMGRKIADLGLAFETHMSPHNCHSPLTSFVAAHFCAAIRNFLILELDEDDVPYRDEILTTPIKIENGHMIVPEAPGLGTDMNMEALEKYAVKA